MSIVGNTETKFPLTLYSEASCAAVPRAWASGLGRNPNIRTPAQNSRAHSLLHLFCDRTLHRSVIHTSPAHPGPQSSAVRSAQCAALCEVRAISCGYRLAHRHCPASWIATCDQGKITGSEKGGERER